MRLSTSQTRTLDTGTGADACKCHVENPLTWGKAIGQIGGLILALFVAAAYAGLCWRVFKLFAGF